MMHITLNSNKSKGFTIIELLIAISISSIVMVALYQTFNSQQKSYLIQEDVATMQQGLRASMLLLANDIRMAGYDSQLSGNFGITDIRPRDISNVVDTGLTGHSSITLTGDFGNGAFSDNGVLDTDETIQYSLYDLAPADGNTDLARDSGGGRQLLAENILGFGLAFAFDDDLDGELDTYTAVNPGATKQIIWAIDSNGDNALDTNLDTNLDGVIDVNDSPGGPGSNGIIVGSALASNVAISNIRAVRIWVLAQTDKPEPSFNNTNTYIIGKYVITPNNSRRMRLLSKTIKCRNLGL
ncbi:MAG: prepilin-type N-terminal cleavage/methylation domain-containing protein [Deltaproteobacteria bacterium]|nr:prepilin-type N-terminal cleavage/methylation domain-containing protein [Deltaproteobacteria bacterium]